MPQGGGNPTIRHNEIRDITTTLLTEICHNIATPPRQLFNSLIVRPSPIVLSILTLMLALIFVHKVSGIEDKMHVLM